MHLHPKELVEDAEKVHIEPNRGQERCPVGGKIEVTEGSGFLMTLLRRQTNPGTTCPLSG